MVTHMERELVLWRQSRPDAKGRGPGVPNFGGYFLFIHGRTPLSQNYKIGGRGNPCEGTRFGRSATPLHLCECVARFVSDS